MPIDSKKSIDIPPQLNENSEKVIKEEEMSQILSINTSPEPSHRAKDDGLDNPVEVSAIEGDEPLSIDPLED